MLMARCCWRVWQTFIDALGMALGQLYHRRDKNQALRCARLEIFQRLAADATAEWASWPYPDDLAKALMVNCNMRPTDPFLVAFKKACARAFRADFAFEKTPGNIDASLRRHHTDELAEL